MKPIFIGIINRTLPVREAIDKVGDNRSRVRLSRRVRLGADAQSRKRFRHVGLLSASAYGPGLAACCLRDHGHGLPNIE